MKKIFETVSEFTPHEPLEALCRTLGEELGNWLDKAIDRLFLTIRQNEKRRRF